MERYVCIHGHFYQPPRENPWLEDVELQDSARPYHDWNERITAECYAPNISSRILDREGRILALSNNYSKMSFNFGPTLLAWLQRHNAEVYEAILEADRLSMERFSGHGSAMAQAFNHLIMPLANRRDKYTQAFWGIRDFEKRFNRYPEGMWLPETAVDGETLEMLADLGMKFTILSPRQALRVRARDSEEEWLDVGDGGIDTRTPYVCVLPSGKEITLFFYDGSVARDIAFGNLLAGGDAFAQRLISAFDEAAASPQIVHVATDGETYGHHHRYGDMALAYCLHFVESQNLARITNYGEYLEKHRPEKVVEIIENSSWSCVHGVARWADNCGCHSGMHPGWTQSWRRPLREAIDSVRDNLIGLYEREASQYLSDPWKARDEYIEVMLDRSAEAVQAFLERNAARSLSKTDTVKVLKLLEMQRNTLLMYTSCGWFFDEVSGLETTQVLMYAARALQLAGQVTGVSLEDAFQESLAKAPSNVPSLGSGAGVYEALVKPARIDILRAGAHYAVSTLFEEYADKAAIYCYSISRESYHRLEAGKEKLCVGSATVRSDITWDETRVSFAVLHLGDHNVKGGVREFMGEDAFSAMEGEVRSAFERGDVLEVIGFIDKHFGMNSYSLWHLFRDEQRKVIQEVLQPVFKGIELAHRDIYEQNYSIMTFIHWLGIPLPRPLSLIAEDMINRELERMFEGQDIDTEKLKRLIEDARKWSVQVDEPGIELVSRTWAEGIMERLSQEPENVPLMEKLRETLMLTGNLLADQNLWKAQDIFFSIKESNISTMRERAGRGEEFAANWVESFCALGQQLGIMV